nr:hypothetical protein [Tanacetum cinerariifolium]
MEYGSLEFQKYGNMEFWEMVHMANEESTSLYTTTNGVAERKNIALKDMVNFMLSYFGLSEGFWGEAMAIVRLPDPKKKTLGEKGIDCIFVGYAEHSNAYRFYVIEPNNSVSINLIIELKDVVFDENHFSSIPRPKDVIPNSVESQRDDHSDDVPIEGSRDQVGSQYSYCFSIEEDPRTYNEAMQSRCKWIFKQKMKVDGTINKFKARLVIQGFRQKEWIDYFDTYAPIARITTIRLLLALVAIHSLVIHQIDIKITFLNGDLDEEVYMKQPEGFVMLCNEHKMCKLVKSLIAQNQVDKTKEFLSSKFSMKDMGEADVILGIKIKRKNKGIVITQSHYIEKILNKFNREDCSPSIGCLMYVMISTRMDIDYAVGRLSRFAINPSRQHWKAITRVFKYLRGTKDNGLSYVGYPSVLEGYSDASWINHVEDSSSTSGWVFLLGGGAIS